MAEAPVISIIDDDQTLRESIVDLARAMGFEAHRAGLLNLRAVGEVVELSFPLLAKFRGEPS